MIRFYLLALSVSIVCLLNGQCVNTFPYVQDFETSQGGWTSGGTDNDWAWGTPAKTVITGAGSGSKCWIVGGLTGNFYNYSEESYVESPCFNFTNLQHPFIQFLIFWESENKYDGTNLEYSLNGGTTWANVGAYGDAVNCLNNNWYNELTIKYLTLTTSKSGWGGNIQADSGSCQGGGGLGHWVTANHCLASLAGQPSVTFRFAFGAGTTCNNFNGFAFDSVAIGEAPVNGGIVSYTCGSFNTISFTGAATLCPDTIMWNFGDPGSGVTDTASALSTAHVFSAAGTYTVSLTLSGPCNAPATINQTVQILDVTATPTNGSCGGGGAIQLGVTGGTGAYTYNWSGGLSGQNPTNVSAGTYTVTVSTAQSCPATAEATVSQSTGSFTASIIPTNTSCGSNNGSATASTSGGTGPYTYVWSNNTTGATISNVSAGTYTVTISGGAGCTATASTTIANSTGLTANATSTDAGCTSNGTASVTASGGNGSYTYVWSNDTTTQTASGLSTGNYTVTVNDGACSATAAATVGNSGAGISITPASTAASCGLVNGSASITITNGTGSFTYHWSNSATGSSINNVASGVYTVTVTSSNSCSATASITIASSGGLTLSPSITATTCGQNNGSASINVTVGAGPYNYAWSNNNTTSGITNAAAGAYNVTVTGSGGCSATAAVNIASSVGITVNMVATNATCGNSNGSLAANVTIGNAPLTYHWSNDSTTASISNLTAGAYDVTIQDGAGCTTVASGTVASSSGTTVSASSNKPIMCSGDTATVCAGGTYAAYEWNTGDTTQCIQTTSPGYYYLTVTDNNNCTAASNHVDVLNYAPTPVTITANGDTLTSYNAVSYQWYFDNQPIPGDTQMVIVATQTGTYTVQITDDNGCHYTSTPVIVNATGISDMDADAAIKVYPNPLSSGTWHVDVSLEWLGGWLEIYDVSGQIIYRSQIQNTSSEIPLYVSDGVYLLRISTQTATSCIKLIKL